MRRKLVAAALAALAATALAARSTAADRLNLFPDGAGFRRARLDARSRATPAVAAAARKGRLDATLRFARHVLGVDDASALINAAPSFASAPLAVVAARHAYAGRVGAAADPKLLSDAPADHAAFAEACGGNAQEVAELVAAFRRGGRRAAADGDVETVRDLLVRGWRPGLDRDRRGASAAHVSAGSGRVDVLRALLDDDAALANDRDGAGATPLHWAACGVSGNAAGTGFQKAAAECLLAAGADAAAATDDGNAVVHWAAWQGGIDAVSRLVHAGADVRAENDRGCTAAHWAAAGGDVETLDYLRSTHGVDLRMPNSAGHTPLEHACAYKRLRVAEWLLDEGVVDASAVEYAVRVAALDDDPDLRAIAAALTTLSVPDI